jgi:hypothetical protein
MKFQSVIPPQDGVPAGTGGTTKFIWYTPTEFGVTPTYEMYCSESRDAMLPEAVPGLAGKRLEKSTEPYRGTRLAA